MKKLIKIILIVLVSIIILITALLVYLSHKPLLEKTYAEKVQTGGEIEAAYLKNGTCGVSYYEEPVLQGFGKYEIYYPAELEETDDKYPVVVFVNGSGVKASKYSALLKHMASWGFIAIGTEEEYDWSGFSPEMCVRHLIRLNESRLINEKTNVFCGRIDLDNIGITGHSQGGVGVLNAITIQEHKDIYKAAVALSPTNQVLAENLEWKYDATKISTPIMLLSGAGGGDDWVVTGEQLEAIYDDIAGSKIMARRVNTDHGSMLSAADGYVTAWFMWLLKGDAEAAGAFTGDTPEIISNALYQDQKKELP